MKLDSRVEKAKRMVSETVRLGRSRGLTNPEAMAEASELLGCTGSRIWTLLYRAETVKSISDAEFRRISNGYREAFRIRIVSIRNKADYHDRVTYALEAGPELPLLPDSESNLAYLRRQTESIERTAAVCCYGAFSFQKEDRESRERVNRTTR